ncbi:hypothetical protein ABJ763_001553 [Escherichia coli]
MRSRLPPPLIDLHKALLLVDEAPLECDGHTMLISNALVEARIPHERILGTVHGQHNGFCLYPHLWLKLDGYIIDYRLRMWVNLSDGASVPGTAPHGIFPANSDEMNYLYKKHQVAPAKLFNKDLLSLISDGFSNKLTIPETTISWYKRHSHDNPEIRS